MPVVKFVPENKEVEVEENTKVLVAGRRAKTSIRFGCASCKCGTCAVKIDDSEGELKPADSDESGMLQKLKLDHLDGVRMACRCRILSGSVTVDLDFQDQYEIPDAFE